MYRYGVKRFFQDFAQDGASGDQPRGHYAGGRPQRTTGASDEQCRAETPCRRANRVIGTFPLSMAKTTPRRFAAAPLSP
jgi:hypothetical protein